MEGNDVLLFLQEKIHTVVMAVNDEVGRPATCAVDIMDCDEEGLYFLTARGKSLYRRLVEGGFVSLTGIMGGHTMSCVAVSVRGVAKKVGTERLGRLLEKNPYMYEIYPTEESRFALTVFCICEGSGEWFDLSKKPIERFSFSFGGGTDMPAGYWITERCTGCGTCLSVCPQNCIGRKPDGTALIQQERCLRCGNCAEVCPARAVERR